MDTGTVPCFRYTAAAFARKYALADSFKVNFKGAVSWAFEFEDQPWFHGFRDLATNGVDKPVLNVFRMYGKMSGKRVKVSGNQNYTFWKIRDSSVRRLPDIDALASRDKKNACIMIWNYHDNDTIAPVSPIEVRITGIPAKKVRMTHYRIDSEHSNSYEVWKKMGSPQQPTPEQVAILEKAGQLAMLHDPKQITVNKGEAIINLELPRQGVSLLRLDW